LRSAIDTNVISEIWSAQSRHKEAKSLLSDALSRGAPLICGIVYAELLAHPLVKLAVMESFLEAVGIEVDSSMDRAVWREAGIRYRANAERRRKAKAAAHRKSLADFIVGAHALMRADRLITFNGSDFRTDFPELRIAPDPAQ
jgi:predicted nucleic acid-binding protein